MTEMLGLEILFKRKIEFESSNHTLRYAKSSTNDEYLVILTDESGISKTATFYENILDNYHSITNENLIKIVSSIFQNK
jgi:hypothetical protein